MKISIITINFNNADGLKKTVESVLCQTYHDFEFVIVDGASTDGGAEYVKEIGQKEYPFALKWVSEKDFGIYNAMNKGVKMSTGEYLLFLNSGDVLCNKDVLETIIPYLTDDFVQGNSLNEYEDYYERYRGYAHSEVDFYEAYKACFLHQTTFIRRELFFKYGMYDESYRMIGDTEFFVRCIGTQNTTFRYVDVDIAIYDLHGLSSDESMNTVRYKERQKLYSSLFSYRENLFMYEMSKYYYMIKAIRSHKLLAKFIRFVCRIVNRMDGQWELMQPAERIYKN